MTEQYIPPGPRRVTEYRYFVKDKSGKTQFRSYYYDKEKWVTEVRPFSSKKASETFKVLNINKPVERALIEQYLIDNGDLRP